jgi:hypothetical protein
MGRKERPMNAAELTAQEHADEVIVAPRDAAT